LNRLKKEKEEEQKRWEEEQREIARQKKLMQLQEDERSAILEVSKNSIKPGLNLIKLLGAYLGA
jgi:hypothetical protein